MNTFPIEGEPIPDGYNGWLLFLDEMNAAPPAVQSASYKLVLDRMVGIYHLHKNVAIVCAGNLETDNAIVQPMSTALQSRLVHLELVVDHKEWLDWATTHDIDYRITGYINFKPGQLYTFQADHTDTTYACPRTWEFASRIMAIVDTSSKEFLPMLAGAISEGVAREFVTFCKIYKELPTISQIVANPKITTVPGEPSVLYALTGSISHNADAANMAALIEFIERMPIEFQVVCLRELLRRKPELKTHAALRPWIARTANELF